MVGLVLSYFFQKNNLLYIAEYNNVAAFFAIGISCFLFLVGGLLILSSKSLNKLLQSIFITTAVFTIVFFVLIVLSLAVAKLEIRPTIEKECNTNGSDLKTLNKLYTIADGALCSATCPCIADRTLWDLPYKVSMVTKDGSNEKF